MTGPTIGFNNTPPSTSAARPVALVGRWSHTETVTTVNGTINSSQIIWEFRSDGSATETVFTTNTLTGITNQAVMMGSWQVTGQFLIVTFSPSNLGSVQFTFTVVGPTLTLNGLDFVRIG